MIKKLYLFSVLFCGNAISQDISKFKDDVILITDECLNVSVDMRSGKLVSMKGDGFMASCVINGLSAKCRYFNDKNKQYNERDMTAGLLHQEGVIASQDGLESFVINLVTRKFYSNSEFNIMNGAMKGSKTCAGDFFYAKEVEKMGNKKK